MLLEREGGWMRARELERERGTDEALYPSVVSCLVLKGTELESVYDIMQWEQGLTLKWGFIWNKNYPAIIGEQIL